MTAELLTHHPIFGSMRQAAKDAAPVLNTTIPSLRDVVRASQPDHLPKWMISSTRISHQRPYSKGGLFYFDEYIETHHDYRAEKHARVVNEASRIKDPVKRKAFIEEMTKGNRKRKTKRW